jgi:acetyl esterase/lipase
MIKKIKERIIEGYNEEAIAVDIFFEDDSALKPVIIYSHGFNGFKDWGNMDGIATQFAEAGFVFVKFNFTHNGTSVEQPEDFVRLDLYAENNYSKELYDLEKVIEYVENSAAEFSTDKNNIFLLGHSLGGGISIITATEQTMVKGLVTWASVNALKTPWTNWNDEKLKEWKANGVAHIMNSRTKQQMPLHYQLYEDHYQNEDRLDIEQALKSFSKPWLICHGTLDEAVPVDVAKKLNAWNPGSELLLLETDHVFGRKHPMNDEAFPEATQQLIIETIRFLKVQTRSGKE